MDEARAALERLAAAGRREARLTGGPGVRHRAGQLRRRRHGFQAVLASTLMVGAMAAGVPMLRPDDEPTPAVSQAAQPAGSQPELRRPADDASAGVTPTPTAVPLPPAPTAGPPVTEPQPLPSGTDSGPPAPEQVPSGAPGEPAAAPPPSPAPSPSSAPARSPAASPAPAPAAPVELQLTSMCSPDPSTVRVWRVRNGDAAALDYRWDVEVVPNGDWS